MSGFYRAIEYIPSQINSAKDTKQSIIVAANSYEYIQKKIKEIEEQAWKEIKEEKPETFHFDANEIESIVLRRNVGGRERE